MSCLRLRIVYDGPAEAGKTTSVESLSKSLGVSVVSPASRGERTLFFDWSEYRGGRFGGAPIYCQLVSVPGQQELFERRKLILETADVVVFVADSDPERLDASRTALAQLLDVCAEAGSRAPRVVIQANKRDLPQAVHLADFTTGLEGAPDLPVLETTATRSAGIRQGFVHAVRLGLARARALDARGLLDWDQDGDSADAAQELFALVSDSMEWMEGAALVDGNSEYLGREQPSTLTSHRRLEEVRPGSVWPPVEGRMCLREAGRQPVSWLPWRRGQLGAGEGWLFHCDTEDAFDTESSARSRLIWLAQRHVGLRPWVDSERCLVVLPEESGSRFRVWQVARRTPTLRDLVDGIVWESPSATVAVEALAELWVRLERIFGELVNMPSPLDVGLDNLRASPERPLLVGIVMLDQGAEVRRRVLDELREAIERLTERHAIGRLLAALDALAEDSPEFKGFMLSCLEPARHPEQVG